MTDWVYRSPRAERDIADLAEYYRTEAGLAVALRFVARAEAATQVLAAYPRIGATLGLTGPERDVRRWHIEGFSRLLMLYRSTESGIHLIRVLDTARDIEELLWEDRP